MKYDLSKVPRPLHDQTLKCWYRPTNLGWQAVVSNDDFQVVVAELLGRIHAGMVVEEINRVLRAHRLLAGKLTYTDEVCS